jgi:hypothetical protein
MLTAVRRAIIFGAGFSRTDQVLCGDNDDETEDSEGCAGEPDGSFEVDSAAPVMFG